ncbi:MAG: hypothetical protein HOE80_02565 [Candidatus Magasanikbacteria bacterium]|jgi:transcriptional regulator of heat shock response|nr:hypothetical protein [Candidatus Magasanikbacteria bacterium]MBT4071584.1 hypothetical protein [Candidatus Magasanikbacteria bacterium]
MLTDRQKLLLFSVVEDYIKTAEPVSSKSIVDNGIFDISGATIRNELRSLEELGYLTHPHTSAGRIPTEIGYQFYVKNIEILKELDSQVSEELEVIFKSKYDQKQKIKFFAKYLAEVTSASIIVAFDKNSLYYTGISQLFSQKEFREYEKALAISVMFDGCEKCLDDLYKKSEEKEFCLIGESNPLSKFCSTLIVPFGDAGLFMLVGPMRMDYGKNIALLEYIKSCNL